MKLIPERSEGECTSIDIDIIHLLRDKIGLDKRGCIDTKTKSALM